MEPRRTPVRRAGLVALAALLALGASSCSDGEGLVGTPPAATVNGVVITPAQVQESVEGSRQAREEEIAKLKTQYADDPATLEQVEAEATTYRAPFKQTGDTYPTTGGASALTDLIQAEIYEQVVAGLGGTVTDADRSSATDRLSQDTTYQAANKRVQTLLERSTAAQIALQRRLPKELGDAAASASAQYEAQLQQVYEQGKDSLPPEVCIYNLPASDRAAAIALGDRVRAGEAAAAVAAEAAGAEAQTQCFDPESVAQIFGVTETPEVGAILGPVSTQSGFSVVVVDSVELPSFESVRQDIAAEIPDEFTAKAQNDIQLWLTAAVSKFVDVHVDARFGTWDPLRLVVEPPVNPATTTTPAIAATDPAAAPVATGS